MKQYSTIEIIRALPLEDAVRTRLLETYPEMDSDAQLEISTICWEAFHKMRAEIQRYWEERIMKEVADGTRKLEKAPDVTIYELVWEEIENRMSGKVYDDAKLDAVRSQLQKLIQGNPI